MNLASDSRPRACRRLRAAARAALTAALLAGAGGCMTIDHLVDPDQRLDMYGGTQASWKYLSGDDSPFFGSFIRFVDLPATVVGDTLLLPIVAPIVLSR